MVLKEQSEFESLKRRGEGLLERHRDLFDVIARERQVRFKVGGNETSKFDADNVHVSLGLNLFKYGDAVALASIFHEIGHLKHMQSDPASYMRMWRRAFRGPQSKILAPLYNVCDDMQVNFGLRAYPPVKKAIDSFYNQQFDEYTKTARSEPVSAQFLFGSLLTSMTGKSPKLAPEAEAAIKELRNYKGVDVIDLIRSTPEVFERHALIDQVVYPVYEKLIKLDKQRDKNFQGPKMDGSGKAGEGGETEERKGNTPQTGEDKSIADIPKELEDALKKAGSLGSPGKGTPEEAEGLPFGMQPQDAETIGKKIRLAAATHGLLGGMTAKEQKIDLDRVLDYRDDYDAIKPHINAVADACRKIVSQRVASAYQLGYLNRNGPVFEPALASQAYTDMRIGRQPTVFRKMTHRQVARPNPGEVTVIHVGDMSGSMNGPEEVIQRRCGMLLTEGMDKVEQETKRIARDLNVKTLGLKFQTSLRRFGSQDLEVKPLDKELTPNLRMRMHAGLSDANEGSTLDHLSLDQVIKHISALPKKEQDRIKTGEHKFVVLVTTDGMSGRPEEAKISVEKLRKAGATVYAFGMGSQAQPANVYGEKFSTVVEDHTKFASAFEKGVVKLLNANPVNRRQR